MRRGLLLHIFLFLMLPCAIFGQGAPDVAWTRFGEVANSRVSGVAVCGPRNLVATCITQGQSKIVLRDLDSGSVVKTINAPIGFFPHLAFSPDGRYLVSSSSTEINLYDVDLGSMLWSHFGYQGPTEHRPVFFPQGDKFLAYGGADYTCSVYDLAGNIVSTFAGSGGAISPDGEMVATHLNNAVKLYNSATGVLIRNINAPNVGGNLAFSPNGLEVCGGLNIGVRVWRISDGSIVASMGSIAGVGIVSYSDDGRYIGAVGGKWEVYDDGQTIASGGSDDSDLTFLSGTLNFITSSIDRPQLFEFAPSGALMRAYPEIAGDIGALSSDGHWAVTTGDVFNNFHESGSFLIDMSTGGDRSYLGRANRPLAGFSPDSTQVSHAGLDEPVMVYDIQSGELVDSVGYGQNFALSGTAAAISYDEVTYDEGTYWSLNFLDVPDGSYTTLDSGLADSPSLGAAISANAHLLATSFSGGGDFTHIFASSNFDLLFSASYQEESIAFSPDDDLFGFGTDVRSLSSGGDVIYSLPSPVLAFSPDAVHAAVYTAGRLEFRNAHTGAVEKYFDEGVENIGSLKWMAGLVLFSGVSGGQPYNRAIFDPFAAAHATPTSLTVTRGSIISGGLSSLLESDDQDLALGIGRTLAASQAPIEIQVGGTVDADGASFLQFKIEGSATIAQIRQTVQLFDYQAGQWVTVDSRQIGTTDGIVTTNRNDNPTRFLQGGQLRVRLLYKKDGARPITPWVLKIDQIAWTISH